MSDLTTTNTEMGAIARVTAWGAVINLVLAALKVAVGFASGSTALIADGLHSVSDLATDAVVLIGAYLGGKPPDRDHPYGHGRFETFATFIVAGTLAVVGVSVAYKAGNALYLHEQFFPGLEVGLVALVSVLAKEALYHATRKVAVRTRTPSLMANAWHHRSDALSSVAVLAGVGASFLGWGHGDQIAGVVVGLMVAGVGVRIAFDCVDELSDSALPDSQVREIEGCLDELEEVLDWHRLRTRRVGRQAFIDVHVLVEPSMTVQDAHDIADRVEHDVKQAISGPAGVTVHIEPLR